MRPGGRRAFTLIEMIAVLAVISLLASALIPVAIRRIDLRTREQEVSNLGSISNALTLDIVRSKVVPGQAEWKDGPEKLCAFPDSRITANARRYNRIYYRESGPTLPYGQDVAGLVSRPDRLRAVIVSILGGDDLDPGSNCPTSDDAVPDTDFQDLWDLPDRARPTTGQWAAWSGRGDDFLVQRVNYGPLFHRLLLVNRDSPVTPRFRIDGSAAQVLDSEWQRFYLDGTVIGLCNPAGDLVTRYVLKRDISFVYEFGKWRCKIRGVPDDNPLANDFGKHAAFFMQAEWNDSAFKGANQQGMVTGMYTFMLTYTFWANRTPYHFPWRTASSIIQVPEYELLANLGDPNGRLDVYSDNLLK